MYGVTMRKRLVAGNWKMNTTRQQANELASHLASAQLSNSVDVAIFPPFVHLADLQNILQKSPVKLGAQNSYIHQSGAYTGEIAADMLRDYGCEYILVGHSERRHVFHEDLNLVATKLKAALDANLTPILCLGETLEQHKADTTSAAIEEQLLTAIQNLSDAQLSRLIIAYEPVWAIGTGLTATPDQAQAVHQLIREILAKQALAVSKSMRILYGGSVKADNVAGLFAQPDIDGVLVGGASLDRQGFLEICQHAAQEEPVR